MFETASLCAALALLKLTPCVHQTGVKRCVLQFWLLDASQYFTVNLCALGLPRKRLQVSLLLEVLVKNIQLPTVDMILFRNKENLIST